VSAETGPEPGTGPALGVELLALVVRARTEGLDPEQELRDAVRALLRRSATGSDLAPT
jgi:hypothetical protein